MPIAFTPRAGAYSSTNAMSHTTASFTPTANSLLLAWVQTSHASAAPTPTLTNRATWTQRTTLVTPNDGSADGASRRLTFYTGVVSASPTAGTVSISHGLTTATGCAWAIVEATGVNNTTPIVQTQSGNTTGNPTAQLLSLLRGSNNANRVIGGFTNPYQNTASALDPNWTVAYNVFGLTPATALTVVYLPMVFNPHPGVNWVSTGNSGGIAVELASATQDPIVRNASATGIG